METRLAFDSKDKQLNLAFKERFVTDSNFQLKINGALNTKTGDVNFRGFVGKFFLAKPRSSSGYAIAADKKQFRLGAGLFYDSRTDKFLLRNQLRKTETHLLGINARKNFQLGNGETWLKISQEAFYDPTTKKAYGVGHARLSKAFFNFTDTQDVRLAIGCDAMVDGQGRITKVPYAQIRENNWSLNTTFKNDWHIRYDL